MGSQRVRRDLVTEQQQKQNWVLKGADLHWWAGCPEEMIASRGKRRGFFVVVVLFFAKGIREGDFRYSDQVLFANTECTFMDPSYRSKFLKTNQNIKKENASEIGSQFIVYN